MYGNDFEPNRLRLLVSTLDTKEWAAGVGVHRTQLYASSRGRSIEVRRRCVEWASEYLGIQPERLALWLCDEKEDADLEQTLQLRSRKSVLRCVGAGPHLKSSLALPDGYFDLQKDKELILPALRMCRSCVREKQTEGSATWEARLLQEQRLPDKMRHAIAVIHAAGKAPTARRIAGESGLDYEDVRTNLKKVGLEKPRKNRLKPTPWIWLALFLRLGTASAEPTKPTSELVGLGPRSRRRLTTRRVHTQLHTRSGYRTVLQPRRAA